ARWRNSSHHFAVEPQIIIATAGASLLARKGKHHYVIFGTQEYRLKQGFCSLPQPVFINCILERFVKGVFSFMCFLRGQK
ncbi:MAG: hypothetical protein J6252_05990, partial [Clostridia bacterium]|nr:hypothetical protein [Clostridia bacterium]